MCKRIITAFFTLCLLGTLCACSTTATKPESESSNIPTQIAQTTDEEIKILIFAAEDEFKKPTVGDEYDMPEMNTVFKEFYAALQQYAQRSDGNITYEFIDPNQEPAKFALYTEYGVEKGDILFLRSDRHRTATITDLSNFNTAYSEKMYSGTYTFESYVEQVLDANLNALQNDQEHIVQVLTGHNEDSYLISGLKTLYELNGYTFEEINILGSSDFNEDAEVMLIAAPSTDYSAEEIKRIQQWVYNDNNYGHHLMVYVNYMADCPNLYELLEVEYEIKVTDELLYETDLDRVYSRINYYPYADIPSTDYTGNSTGTASLLTPLARRLTTTLPSVPEQEDAAIYTVGVPLIQYPESAQLMKLEVLKDEDNQELTPYDAPKEEYPLTSMIMCEIKRYNNNTQTATHGTVMVSGASQMAYSELIQTEALSNKVFLLDVINRVNSNTLWDFFDKIG